MKTIRGLAFLSVVVLASGCGGGGGGQQGTRLNAGGSSFIYPLMTKWASEYNKLKGVEVNYQSIGSGGGIQQMTAKTFDFGCTDGPMNDEQIAKCRAQGAEPLHIPLVHGAVVVIYTLEEVKEPLRFSGPVLADIYLGKVKKWNDAALKQLNPSAPLPDKDILVVHRSDGSGTTYIWADYLAKVSDAWKNGPGVATSLNWPVGVAQKGSEGIAGQVRRTPGSIGYVEMTYALQNKMQFGQVKNKAGAFIEPSLKAVTAAANDFLESIPDDLRFSITDAPGKDAYPISGTTWAVVYNKLPAGNGQAVVDFLRWVTHDGQQYCEALDYSRLPPGLVTRLEKKLDEIKVGG
jgi:phosphate transport system substrate-binding protein